MKYEPGDKIIVKLTNEDGKVLEIINEKMVLIEVKGVKFPAYTDQLDFPYFKMFTEKREQEKKKVYIDNIKTEKKAVKAKENEGVQLSFLPVYQKDVFDDDVVEKFKIYLINKNNEGYQFTYNFVIDNFSRFRLNNTILPQTDFYLHDVPFEDLSDNPKFDFEFSQTEPKKGKAPHYEASLKLKGKQVFKKLEEIQLKNEPQFAYELFHTYPDKIEEEKVDLSKLGNAGFRVYDAAQARQHMAPARSVIDLHIEKLTDSWKHMSNFEILTLQLQTFEKYYDLAVAHHLHEFTVIHGVGAGKLREEIHDVLRLKKEVTSFVNQYTDRFGYGATEIYFKY